LTTRGGGAIDMDRDCPLGRRRRRTAKKTPENRQFSIVGGTETAVSEFPHMASTRDVSFYDAVPPRDVFLLLRANQPP